MCEDQAEHLIRFMKNNRKLYLTLEWKSRMVVRGQHEKCLEQYRMHDQLFFLPFYQGSKALYLPLIQNNYQESGTWNSHYGPLPKPRAQKSETGKCWAEEPSKAVVRPSESSSLLPPMDSEIKFSFNDYVVCNKAPVSRLLGHCVGDTILPRPHHHLQR